MVINLISRAIAQLSSLLKGLQIKNVFAAVLVGVLLLTTHGNYGQNNSEVGRDRLHQTDSVRPKTTGEWNQEARETEGQPGKRVQKIVEESAEAIKEFGSMYPDTAKRSLSEANNNQAQKSRNF